MFALRSSLLLRLLYLLEVREFTESVCNTTDSASLCRECCRTSFIIKSSVCLYGGGVGVG